MFICDRCNLGHIGSDLGQVLGAAQPELGAAILADCIADELHYAP